MVVSAVLKIDSTDTVRNEKLTKKKTRDGKSWVRSIGSSAGVLMRVNIDWILLSWEELHRNVSNFAIKFDALTFMHAFSK